MQLSAACNQPAAPSGSRRRRPARPAAAAAAARAAGTCAPGGVGAWCARSQRLHAPCACRALHMAAGRGCCDGALRLLLLRSHLCMRAHRHARERAHDLAQLRAVALKGIQVNEQRGSIYDSDGVAQRRRCARRCRRRRRAAPACCPIAPAGLQGGCRCWGSSPQAAAARCCRCCCTTHAQLSQQPTH